MIKKELENLSVALKETFRYISSVAIAASVSISVFLFVIWFPNFGYIRHIFASNHLSLATKFGALLYLVGGIRTNFTAFSAAYTIIGSILFGIYAAMLVRHYRDVRATQSGSGHLVAGIGGAVSAALGIGCAACGSFFLAGTLSVIGASGGLAVLPFGGAGFGLLGVSLLGLAIALIARKIAAPLVCEVQQP